MKRRNIDADLLRRWSLYLSWRHGDTPPEDQMARAEEACLRGEEPPDDGWELEMSFSEEWGLGWPEDEGEP